MRLRFASLLAVVACLACSTPEERLAEHLDNGARFAKQKEFDKAIVEYRSAHKLAPDNAEANERLGRQLETLQPDDAAVYFRDAFRLDPERIQAALSAAQIMMRTDVDAATQLIDEVIAQSPKNASAFVVKSELALIQNKSREALAAARKARKLDPSSVSGWYQSGRAYQARILEGQIRRLNVNRDFNAAIHAFLRADELAGGSIRSKTQLARVYSSRASHWSRAQAAFKDAMELARETGSSRDQLNVAEAALEFSKSAKDPAYSEWILRAVIETDPGQLLAWSQLAMLEDANGGDGRELLEDLIEKRPFDVSAQLIYTTYLILKGRETRAIAHLRGLLDSDLNDPAIWEQITRIQIDRNKIPNARATYVSMLDHHAGHLVARRTDARIAIAERRYEAASKSLRELAAESDSQQIQFLLAESELGRGNLPNAAAAIERARPERGDTPVDVLRLSIRIHHAAGDFELAVQSYRKLMKTRAAVKPIETLLFAQSLYETDDPASGREVLEELLAKPRPLDAAAAEYARRESKREPLRAYQYLITAHGRNPVDYDVLKELTRFDTAAGREGPALLRLNRALKTGRADARVVLLRGRALADAGQFAKAERDVLRALEVEPMLEGAVELLFSIYLHQGTLLHAQSSFEEAEAAGVLHSGTRQLLGRIYRHHGDDERARQILEKLETEDPKMLGAKADLALLLAEAEDELDRALELAEEVQQHRGRDASAADVVGYVYLRKGLHEAALQQFQYAIELDEFQQRPSTSHRQYHLGLALRALNRDDEATQAFENALQLDPDFRSAEDARIQLEATRSSNGNASTSS